MTPPPHSRSVFSLSEALVQEGSDFLIQRNSKSVPGHCLCALLAGSLSRSFPGKDPEKPQSCLGKALLLGLERPRCSGPQGWGWCVQPAGGKRCTPRPGCARGLHLWPWGPSPLPCSFSLLSCAGLCESLVGSHTWGMTSEPGPQT